MNHLFFRAQLLTDPAQNTQLLTEQLRSLGLYAAPTLGDGNCLFRALSDQLYGTPSYHLKLRKEICDWIEGHKARYEPFVEDDRGLDVHLNCMRENGTSSLPNTAYYFHLLTIVIIRSFFVIALGS
jgi:OTU domain-containing protein 3